MSSPVVIGISSDDSGGRVDALSPVMRRYERAVLQAGGRPLFLSSAQGSSAGLEGIDGLLIPGGRDIPSGMYGGTEHSTNEPCSVERVESDATLIAAALGQDLPILGVCYGLQILNVVMGGTLLEDIALQWENPVLHRNPVIDGSREDARHGIRVDSTARHLDVMPDSFTVNSSHHQAVLEPGDGLVATAWAEDGLIEAVESREHRFVLGIQWHPERLPEAEAGLELIRRFCAAAGGATP